MKGIVPETPVYLWLGVTDMRAGFERLSAVVQLRMSRSVTSGGLYVTPGGDRTTDSAPQFNPELEGRILSVQRPGDGGDLSEDR